ncbi:fibronectin type III domain-containing protein [Bradymonas sediminis]|uniref:Uncharacterized protein n=1 Tax=Bradymonas sediminis TaxID=1548548 RepID=A0A2Z4FKE2_9DELT|nr:fibronectin type III domain-containing protein [Bradymonas sediminis]AWV89196.1 hypothetical protein DN745_07520 [Bradymonas sediminis]TDP73363.1 WD40 repeat protein [Bradymonas sediminis]
MRPNLHPIILYLFVFLLLVGCSASENRDGRNTDTTAPNDVKTDTEEDIRDDPEDIGQDINEVEDIDEEGPEPSLQNVRSEALEGMVNFSWDLPEDNTYTEIRITASPADLMWGEAERGIDPDTTEYLFDKLVNDVDYTFEIQAFSEGEEVGETIIFEATPYSRPLLSVSGAAVIDSVTKQPAFGWKSLIEQVGGPASWSPDGTTLLTYLGASQRCALFDRATREEIQLEPSAEFGNLCLPFDYSWSPDSHHLAFTRRQTESGNASNVIFFSVLDTQTGEIEPGWPDPSEIHSIRTLLSLDWSPDGKRLVISPSYSDGSSNVMIINTETKEFEPDWPDLTTPSPSFSIDDMQWSPDSKRLALAHPSGFYNATEAGYLIVNAETKEVETDWPEIVATNPDSLAWSPDGGLLILAYGYSRNTGMQVINTATRENEPGWPTEWPRIQDVAWSHDSEILAISSTESPYLLIIDRDSKTIADGWAPLTEPVGKLSWSPQHDPPTAPTDVEVTRTNSSATLSWTAPADAKILDYRVTIEPAAQVDGPADYLVFDPAATEHVIEGLDPAVEYSVSISAISVFGVGEAATSSSF